MIAQYTEMSIQHYEHSFVDPIAYGRENIQEYSAISTTDNNTNKPYLVCGIPNEEDKLQCNMCGKWFKGINKHKYNCVRKFKKSGVSFV